MKLKFLFILVVAGMFTATALQAQTQIKEQQEQIKSRYELQKKTIQNAFKTDMDAIKAQKNLSKVLRLTPAVDSP